VSGNGFWNAKMFPNFPRTGWALHEIDDQGDQDFLCEMCQAKWIRYVHTVTHPDGHELEVGCECSSQMTGDRDLCERRDAAARNQAKRRKSFLAKEWHTSAHGNPWLKYHDHHIVLIEYPSRCAMRLDGERTFHDSVPAAKLAAFAVIDGDHGFSACELALLNPEANHGRA
jgi:hypothetical protein